MDYSLAVLDPGIPGQNGGRVESIVPAYFIISRYKFTTASILAKDSGKYGKRVSDRAYRTIPHPAPTPKQDPDQTTPE